MKKILISLLFCLTALTLSGQIQVNLPYDGGKLKFARWDKPAQTDDYYNMVCLKFDENLFLVYEKGSKYWYLGDIVFRKRRDNAKTSPILNEYLEEPLRDGYGLEKVVDVKDGQLYDEYYLGFWKKNFKHGEGMSMDPSGKVVVSEWRYGKQKSGTCRSATEDELNSFLETIERLNTALSMCR